MTGRFAPVDPTAFEQSGLLGPDLANRLAASMLRIIDPAVGELCWIWVGAIESTAGYGRIWTGQPTAVTSTHRVARLGAHGPIPPGHVIRHRCDTPLCARPDHLGTGTRSENNRDIARHGRTGRAGDHTAHSLRLRTAVVDRDWDTTITLLAPQLEMCLR